MALKSLKSTGFIKLKFEDNRGLPFGVILLVILVTLLNAAIALAILALLAAAIYDLVVYGPSVLSILWVLLLGVVVASFVFNGKD